MPTVGSDGASHNNKQPVACAKKITGIAKPLNILRYRLKMIPDSKEPIKLTLIINPLSVAPPSPVFSKYGAISAVNTDINK